MKYNLLILALFGALVTSCSNQDQEVMDADSKVSINDSIPAPTKGIENNAISIDTVWAGETVINFDQTGEWGE